jgi:hypothetical protein
MPEDKPMCLSCGRELELRDVREAVVHSSLFPKGELYGPLCSECAQRLLEGVPFERWLDKMRARKRPS